MARMRPRLGSVRLELALAPDLPEIAADPVQLDQVLTNLLENAARHSPSDGVVRIHIGLTRRTRFASGSPTKGPGIPASNARRCSKPSIVAARSRSVRAAASGWRSSRAIVTAHGGRIWVEETTGGGTAVVFDLPIEEEVEA